MLTAGHGQEQQGGRRRGQCGGARAYGRPRAEAGKEEDEAVASPGFVGTGQRGARRSSGTTVTKRRLLELERQQGKETRAILSLY